MLSGPTTTFHGEEGAIAEKSVYAVRSMQGWRPTNEDAYLVERGCPNDNGMYCIFDGHGGTFAANFLKNHLSEFMRKIMDSSVGTIDVEDEEALRNLLVQTFEETDRSLHAACLNENQKNCGSTGCVCSCTKEYFVTAWVGDSRAVLSRKGGKAVPLTTFDHKPTCEDERLRVCNAGGVVVNNRVNAVLAVSRAFGDFFLKDMTAKSPDMVVTSTPSTTCIPRMEGDEFLLLACDGIWDVMSCDRAIGFVRESLRHDLLSGGGRRFSPNAGSIAAEKLINKCLGLGSRDNMSAMVVMFPDAERSLRQKASLVCTLF